MDDEEKTGEAIDATIREILGINNEGIAQNLSAMALQVKGAIAWVEGGKWVVMPIMTICINHADGGTTEEVSEGVHEVLETDEKDAKVAERIESMKKLMQDHSSMLKDLMRNHSSTHRLVPLRGTNPGADAQSEAEAIGWMRGYWKSRNEMENDGEIKPVLENIRENIQKTSMEIEKRIEHDHVPT